MSEERKPVLTDARRRILSSAKGDLGIITQPHMTGFERVSWNKNAAYLCAASLMVANAHGDWYITEAGRDYLKETGQ